MLISLDPMQIVNGGYDKSLLANICNCTEAELLNYTNPDTGETGPHPVIVGGGESACGDLEQAMNQAGISLPTDYTPDRATIGNLVWRAIYYIYSTRGQINDTVKIYKTDTDKWLDKVAAKRITLGGEHPPEVRSTVKPIFDGNENSDIRFTRTKLSRYY